MFVCDYVCNLWGVVQSSQVSGFPREYTEFLLTAMFGDGKKTPDFKTPKWFAWPVFLPKPDITRESKEDESTTGNFEDRIREIVGPKEQSNSTIKITDRENDVEVSGRPSITITNNDDPAQPIQQTQSNTPLANGSATSKVKFAIPHLSKTKSGLSKSYVAETDPVRPSTPEQGGSISIPGETSKSGSFPISPNTMNRLNEQDPAFRRTLDALRPVESTPMVKSVLFSHPYQPGSDANDLNHSKLGGSKPGAADKSQPSFMGKIKGMFSK